MKRLTITVKVENEERNYGLISDTGSAEFIINYPDTPKIKDNILTKDIVDTLIEAASYANNQITLKKLETDKTEKG